MPVISIVSLFVFYLFKYHIFFGHLSLMNQVLIYEVTIEFNLKK